jgi:septum formation protein
MSGHGVGREGIILASASPRRKDLLRGAGIDFKTVKSRVAEPGKLWGRGTPASRAVQLAIAKARDVASRNKEDVVLGADTLVVVGERILGKPKDSNDAHRMLRLLSGRWHEVITGVAVVRGGKQHAGWERTRVKFRNLTFNEIDKYVATGEPLDKAGGYAIQGGARHFVAGIKGDYTNVVGLPMNLVVPLLSKL